MAAARAARTRLSVAATCGIGVGALLGLDACGAGREAPVARADSAAPLPAAAARAASGVAAPGQGVAAESQMRAWTEFAALLPDRMNAMTAELNRFDRSAGSPGPSAAEVARARVSEREIYARWSKARAAFAQRNMPEAVATAEDVAKRLDALAAAIKP